MGFYGALQLRDPGQSGQILRNDWPVCIKGQSGKSVESCWKTGCEISTSKLQKKTTTKDFNSR